MQTNAIASVAIWQKKQGTTAQGLLCYLIGISLVHHVIGLTKFSDEISV